MDSTLFPTSNELLCQDDRSLFPNIIKGEYPDVDTYLDIHYTLQREDFIRPLREGIATVKGASTSKAMSSLRVFHSVRFGNVNKVSHELGIDVLFSTEDYAEEDWENCKQFMRGSLLIFSPDNFNSIIVGTVLQRNPAQLRHGCVTVQLNEVSHVMLERSGVQYTMAEPDTYFLPYSQVMKVLQSLDESTFPFRNEIVYAYNGTFELEYLDDSTLYRLPQGASVPALQIGLHMTHQQMDLNESQFHALVAALTQRLVLIQGPPGTGKTHLGTKIAEILINNSQLWNKGNNTPMLIVCATNHTLDHFLEQLLPITEKLIRVGDQSKNQKLNDYTLHQLLRVSEDERQNQSFEMRNAYKRMMLQWNLVEEGLQEKGKLGSSLVEKYELEKKIFSIERDYHNAVQQFKNLQQDKVLQKLQGALVIGMTTTCAAQMHSTLLKLKPPIVFVEEAAEIPEAHVIAALNQYCKHLILIGDHKQLRPITAHPYLSEKCHLDVSLFERLINNGVHCEVLLTQHRMRPEIARLLSPVFYPTLFNHSCTLSLPNITGLKKNVFFMTHSHSENQHKATHGYSNMFEATYLLALCMYLLKQGYKTDEIVILSMYTQQVRLLKELQQQKPNLKGLRIFSVDNFQGQESCIILLSLVRNSKGTIGFLRNQNRTCVALSRAKNGLYILGNIDLLASQSPTWKKMKDILVQHEVLGPGLPVNCLRHPILSPSAFSVLHPTCSSCSTR